MMRVTVNGVARDLAAGATVADLLEAMEIRLRFVVVERNGEPVLTADFAATVLADGDRLEVVKPTAGG